MALRSIEAILPPDNLHYVGDGFRVYGILGRREPLTMKRMSPFLLMDYAPVHYFAPNDGPPRGVGSHPHRGIETVTIAYKGKVEHNDSTGAGGIIEEGGVQWMTSGKGILHKEYHEKNFSKKGGEMQMVQLWVNLPAKDKMTEPKYQNIEKNDLAKVDLGNGVGTIDIIAGEFENNKGPASSFSPLSLFNVKLKKGKGTSLSFKESHNTGLLVIKGNVTINNSEKAPTNHFVLFNNKGSEFTIRADDDAEILILSGEPIDEPIASYGPFVMNTNDEIRQTIDDFNNGKFGYLD
ncbi:pirin family protein [Candidatus Pseudothioglobus singularis]|jgi:redox-sensitive bicupin YhaK (pirin superfamily)|nr:pirin family protein [Candidatus Pseudothioglobus singularis]MBT4974652.1 pirin family protein [Gammaproteobacteria bacterium]MDA8813762.1 pirin family protein [Candidatus Pseudothioglobus singularis]MDB4821434.1 pirin family protein [Candidatus Pseudothioglobus singularis]MDB4846869.1 pirin family protein [Candidatus Pseudothioglobus singularis]